MPLNDTEKALSHKLDIVHEEISYLRDELKYNPVITFNAGHVEIKQELGRLGTHYTDDEIKKIASYEQKDLKVSAEHTAAFKTILEDTKDGVLKITHNALTTVQARATNVVNQLLEQNPTSHKCKAVTLDAWKAAFQEPLKKFDQDINNKIKELEAVAFEAKDGTIVYGYTGAPEDKTRFETTKTEQIEALKKLKDDVRKEVEAQQNTKLMEVIQSAKFCDNRFEQKDHKDEPLSLISSPARDGGDQDHLNKRAFKKLKDHFVLCTAQSLELEEKLWVEQVTNTDSPIWHTRGKIIKNADDLTQEDDLVGIYDPTSRWRKNLFIHIEEKGVRIYPGTFGTDKNHIEKMLLLYTQKTGSRNGILQAGKRVKLDDLMEIARVSAAAGYHLTLGDETVKKLQEGGVSPEQIAGLRQALIPVAAAPVAGAVPPGPPPLHP